MTPLWLWESLRAALRRAPLLDRFRNERGQVEAFIIALAIFVLILLISGRRIVVQ
jgi:hypothetical protein